MAKPATVRRTGSRRGGEPYETRRRPAARAADRRASTPSALDSAIAETRGPREEAQSSRQTWE